MIFTYFMASISQTLMCFNNLCVAKMLAINEDKLETFLKLQN